MKPTSHEVCRVSIAEGLPSRAKSVTRALVEIGIAAALALPGPMALAAEASTLILARETRHSTVADSPEASGSYNDPSRVAVRTAATAPKGRKSAFVSAAVEFDHDSLAIGGRARLELQVYNTRSGYDAVVDATTTLALPAGLTVASPANVGTSCQPYSPPAPMELAKEKSAKVLVNQPGATEFSIPAFVELADATSCSHWIDITPGSAGSFEVPTGSPSLEGHFVAGGVSYDTFSASISPDDLDVYPNPTAGVSFDPGSVAPGQTSVLTLTFTNAHFNSYLNVDGQIGLGSLAVSSLDTDCDGSPYVSGSVLHVPGVWVDPEDSCSVTLNVTAPTAGSYPVPVSSTTLAGYYDYCGSECYDSFATGKSKYAKSGFATSRKNEVGTFPIQVSAGTLVVQAATPPPAPVLSIPTSPIAFPNTAAGSTSAPVPLVVTNSGNAPLTISGISGSGGAFGIANGCPVSPGTLAPGATCTLNLTFAPRVPGLQSGTITIQSDGGFLAVSVSGTGIPGSPAVNWSFNPTSVTAGASASLQVSIANPNAAIFTSTGFSQALPSGLVIAATPSVSNPALPCAGTMAPPAAGATSFTVNGLSVPASGSCGFSVNVTSATPGTYGVSTAAGAISGSVASVAVASAASNTASLAVAAAPGPTVAKSFAPGSVVAGANATLTVSLSNPNAVPITSLAFTDSFPTGLASSGDATNNCGGTASGGSGLSLSGGTLQANGGCQVSIPVSAARAGSYTNTIAAGAATGLVGASAVTNAAAASAVLEVTPAPAPGVAFTPSALDFGVVTINSVSGAKRATIANSGNTPLNFSGAFGVSGPFSHTSNCPASLAPTQGCTVDVSFAPAAVGPASGALTVASNAPGSPHSLPLSGTGDPLPVPGVSLSPATLSFSGQTVATTSSPQSLSLSNSGKLALAISGIGTVGDFGQSNNCPASLAPSTSCAINVTFTPLVAGTRTGSLTVASNAPGSPHAAALTGLGVAIPAPTVSVSPSSVSFPSTQLGTTTGTTLVTVRNTGNAPLVVSSVDIVGAGFILGSNTCNVPVAPGGECSIGIVFAPPALGPASATLRISGNTPSGPSYVGLSGTGIPVPVARLGASPGALAFAERVIGTSSEALPVTISNSGTASAALGGIGLSDGDFAATTTCGSSLEVGASCLASVTFTPTAVGARSGTLAVLDSALNPLVTVSLSGRGAPLPVPVIEVSATSITFGNTTIPGASSAQSFTVRNAGGAPLTITSLAVTGDFVVANGCTAPVATGADCRIDVSFTPHVPGPRSGTISILSNATNGTPVVNLAGTGCRLNFRTFALVCQ